MTEARMTHEQIEHLAATFAALRDSAARWADKYPASREEYLNRSEAYGGALHVLHVHSDGAYGQTVSEQQKEAS
jgi:hypothetical protein